MKKVLFLITFLMFIGCANSEKKESLKNFKIYKGYCDNWEIDKLKSELQKIQDKDLEKKINRCLQEKEKYQKNMNEFLKKLSNSIKNNQIDEIENNFEDSIRNRKIIQMLKESDFSQVKIIIGKPKYYKNAAKNIVGFLFLEEVIYLSIDYEIIDGEWRVVRVRDGRK